MTKRATYKLPENVSPNQTICIKMEIPDDIDHINAFLGQVNALSYWFSWDRDENKTGRDVALVWRGIFDDLEENLRNNDCETKRGFPMLRQNPSNKCQMQYEDEFGSWVTFFDFSLCSSIAGSSVIDYDITNEYVNQANNAINIYLGDEANYPTQGEINALAIANRDKLLCYALREILTAMLESIARDVDGAERGVLTMTLITGAIIALGFTPFSPLVTGLILGGFTVGGLIGLSQVGGDEYRDSAGQDKVICYIYENMKGDNLSRAGLQSSLSGNNFEVGTPEYAQANALSQLFTRPQTYLALIEHMKANLSKVDALVNECDTCNQGEWEYTFDFTQSSHSDWWTNSVAISSPNNVIENTRYVISEGWGEGRIYDGSRQRDEARIESGFTATITGCDVEYRGIAGTSGSFFANNLVVRTLNSQGQITSTLASVAPSMTQAGIYTRVSNFGAVDVTRLLVAVSGYQRAGNNNPNGATFIRRITLRGIGNNPFE